MTAARLLSAKLLPDAIAIALQQGDGQRLELELPMTDFILLRLQLDKQANPPAGQSSPPGPKQIQVIDPEQLTVFQDPLSGDPILQFGVRQLGDLPIRIPRNGLPGMVQQLLPFLSKNENPAQQAS